MAFVMFLIGGVSGIAAMFASLLAYDASLLSALGIWFATGMTVSLIGISLSLIQHDNRVHAGSIRLADAG